MDITSYLLGKNSSGGGADISEYLGNSIEGFKEYETIKGSVNELIKKIPDNITFGANITNINDMFKGCVNLVDIPLLDTSNVTSIQNTFSYCTNLSNESLNNILAMCTNSKVKEEFLKSLDIVGLTPEQIETCKTLSNYQAFLNAGWTDVGEEDPIG